jgi:hypothetical protein
MTGSGMNTPNDPFIADLAKRMEERAAAAARRPTQAREFQSEAEVEAALARMAPIEADAVRLLAAACWQYRDEIETDEQFNGIYDTVVRQAIEADQVRQYGSSHGVSLSMLMCFEADHSIEVRRVTSAIMEFRLRGMTFRGQKQASTGCLVFIAASFAASGLAAAGAAAVALWA